MAKIGQILDSTAAAHQTSDASKSAAVEADAKAQTDQSAADAADAIQSKALAKTGPITKSMPDGTFATYSFSTTAPGYRVEISQSVDADYDDGTVVPTPAPVPAPAPVPVPTPAPASDSVVASI